MTYPLTTKLSVTRDMLPFAYLDDVCTNEELNEIIRYCNSLKLEDARVGGDSVGQMSPDRKSKVSHFGMNEQNVAIFNRLQAAATYMNNEFFRFDLVGFDSIQYTEYRDGNDLYNFHVDCWMGQNTSPEHAFPRKLSCSFVLSDPSEYEGGQFEVMYSSAPTEIPQKKGRLLVFPSYMLHRVRPVTHGSRKSLVFWIIGPKFK